uniref:Uncharacterized protein n=1 Tax=Ignisphaera aggregans TaxID=334771 RepID=A0A7C2Z1M7_9CREN
MSKEVIINCVNNATKLLETMLRCSDCIELYVDYSLLRYPYASVLGMMLKCNDSVQSCNDLLYSIVFEATFDLDNTIFQRPQGLEKSIVSCRIMCGEGWLEYGYVLPRAHQGVQHVSKGFTLFLGGRRLSIDAIDEGFAELLEKLLEVLIPRIRTIMESEGMI